jgi:hypothetical protein
MRSLDAAPSAWKRDVRNCIMLKASSMTLSCILTEGGRKKQDRRLKQLKGIRKFDDG